MDELPVWGNGHEFELPSGDGSSKELLSLSPLHPGFSPQLILSPYGVVPIFLETYYCTGYSYFKECFQHTVKQGVLVKLTEKQISEKAIQAFT